jgi:hypothetical protein
MARMRSVLRRAAGRGDPVISVCGMNWPGPAHVLHLAPNSNDKAPKSNDKANRRCAEKLPDRR